MKHISLAHKIPRRLVTVSFAILLFGPGAARAAECPESSPEDAQERRKFAKEWFSTAEAAENSGNDTEATRAYACSYKMVAHPFTAFNLARVAERSGDADLALKMYKAYLALKPDAKDKEDVKSKIKALEEKLAAVKEAGTGAGATEATTEAPTPLVPPPDVLTPPPEPKPAGVVERKPAEPEPEPVRPSRAAEWIVGSVAVAWNWTAVYCPAGRTATGGGFDVSSSATYVTSLPDANGWRVYCTTTDGGTHTATSYVRCCRVPGR